MTAAELYRLEKSRRDAAIAPALDDAKKEFAQIMDQWKIDRSAPTPHNHPMRPMRGRKWKNDE